MQDPIAQDADGVGPARETRLGGTAVVLDQHPLWLDAVGRLLEQLAITSVSKVTRPSQALAAILEQRPALFVLDTDVEGDEPNALECVRQACVAVAGLKVVVVSTSDDPRKIEEAFAAGAVAYGLKRAEADDLVSAVRQAFQRSLYLPTRQRAARPATAQVAATPNAASDLTARERQILASVADGSTNKQVAARLWVTEQTIKFHLANIFRKLDVANRTQASRWAHSHGIVGTGGTQQAMIDGRGARQTSAVR